MLSGVLLLLHLQARRVRAGLADGQSSAEMRRLWPYGSQFACDWLTRIEVARGAAAGLEYMHQHGVIHRDLTSYNLLLDFGKPWQVRALWFKLWVLNLRPGEGGLFWSGVYAPARRDSQRPHE
jgi:hypothetical protein